MHACHNLVVMNPFLAFQCCVLLNVSVCNPYMKGLERSQGIRDNAHADNNYGENYCARKATYLAYDI